MIDPAIRPEWNIVHGTYSGYQLERLHGMKPCDACSAANRDKGRRIRYDTAKYQRTGCARSLGWPLEDPVMARISRAGLNKEAAHAR